MPSKALQVRPQTLPDTASTGMAVAAAVPPPGRSITARRPPKVHARQRVNQDKIDRMAALRRQGFSFKDIGARVGCSERTARRYANAVRPELHLPTESSDLTTKDPRVIRADLLAEFMETLYRDKGLRGLTVVCHRDPDPTSDFWTAEYGNPPSILFLNEAERLLREALDSLGPHATRMLARDVRSKRRFIREIVGPLYGDYIAWHRWQQEFGEEIDMPPYWRPPSERPPGPQLVYENPYGFPED